MTNKYFGKTPKAKRTLIGLKVSDEELEFIEKLKGTTRAGKLRNAVKYAKECYEKELEAEGNKRGKRK